MQTDSQNNALIADVWQKIPPEEKLELAASAQSTGISAILCLLAMGGAVAVGLKLPWILWGSFLLVPLAFQVASSKAWNIRKPEAIVRYTAARATACCYASQANGHDLIPLLTFQATLERPESEEQHDDSFQQNTYPQGSTPAWVTVFPDSLVIFSETPYGSHRELAISLLEEFSVSSEGLDEPLAESKKLIITLQRSDGVEQVFTLTSAYPKSLAACERKLLSAIEKRDFFREQATKSKRAALGSLSRMALGA